MAKGKYSESDLQRHCVSWFRVQYPHLAKRLFAIPNGGSRNKIEAVNLKRQGVISGVSDLFLSIPMGEWSGCFIELKIGQNGLSENQEEFIKAHEKDYSCHVCYSLEEFQGIVRTYLSLKKSA